jgi:hypothetical protein
MDISSLQVWNAIPGKTKKPQSPKKKKEDDGEEE